MDNDPELTAAEERDEERDHPGPITHLSPQSLRNLFRGDTAVRSFWCCLREVRKGQPQLFDLQRPSLSPERIRAVTRKAALHPRSLLEQHQTKHLSPGIPGPRGAPHQPHITSLGISNPGWYLLHHQADLAPLKQKGCIYFPYSYLPKRGLAPTAKRLKRLSPPLQALHIPGAAQMLLGWSTEPTKDKDNSWGSMFWHRLPASPSFLAAPQSGVVLQLV